jgi:hypothetical protein
MSTVTATITLDAVKGTAKFVLDLQGHSEIEHEVLAAVIGTGRSVSITPRHNGDELFAEFTVADKNIWPAAIHNLDNRHRKAEGRPSIEEEEEQNAEANAAQEGADKKRKEQEAKDKAASAK